MVSSMDAAPGSVWRHRTRKAVLLLVLGGVLVVPVYLLTPPEPDLEIRIGGFDHAVFSPDNKTLVACSYAASASLKHPDRSVVAVDLATAKERFALPTGYADKVHWRMFSPDSKSIALSKAEGLIEVLDSQSGQPISLIEGDFFLNDLGPTTIFFPDSRHLLVKKQSHANEKRGFAIVNITTGDSVSRFEADRLAVSADGARALALTGEGDSTHLTLWNLLDLAQPVVLKERTIPCSWPLLPVVARDQAGVPVPRAIVPTVVPKMAVSENLDLLVAAYDAASKVRTIRRFGRDDLEPVGQFVVPGSHDSVTSLRATPSGTAIWVHGDFNAPRSRTSTIVDWTSPPHELEMGVQNAESNELWIGRESEGLMVTDVEKETTRLMAYGRKANEEWLHDLRTTVFGMPIFGGAVFSRSNRYVVAIEMKAWQGPVSPPILARLQDYVRKNHSWDTMAWIGDVASGEEVMTLPNCMNIAFSADDALVASVHEDGVRVWSRGHRIPFFTIAKRSALVIICLAGFVWMVRRAVRWKRRPTENALECGGSTPLSFFLSWMGSR